MQMDENIKICAECGHVNSEDNKFCENCGHELDEVIREKEESVCEEDSAISEENPSLKKKSKMKKIIIITIIALLVLAGAAVAVMKYMDSRTSEKYDTKMNAGDKYMNDLDYEKAEASYLSAIKIDPKQSQPYVKVADVYIEQEDYEKAEKILEKGEKNAGGKKIRKKLRQVRPYNAYSSYTNEEAVSETGIATVDEETYLEDFETGLLSGVIDDFNGDGVQDLLMISYDISGDGIDNTAVYTTELYTYKKNEIVLLDQMECEYKASTSVTADQDVFIKRHEDETYLIFSHTDSNSAGIIGLGDRFDISIFSISDKFEKVKEVNCAMTESGGNYYVDGDEIINGGQEYKHGSNIANTLTKGAKAVAAELTSYGIEESRVMEEDTVFVSGDQKSCYKVKMLECDEEDDSEYHLCSAHTEKSPFDTFFEDTDKLVIYLEDHTGLRDRIGR